jgi:hypothetical protein
MLGFWLQQERGGFDYSNKEKVKKQFEYFKTVVDQFKNHPALLFWGIGNELDLDYSNPDVWYAVQDLAKYTHQTDPNHPTSTVTAGLDSADVKYITARCPDIDIYCINTYGDIENVPKNIQRFGWNGPYMITEWGPNGHWESPKTEWGVSIEQSSTEKRDCYYNRYKKYIEPNKNYCLGSYAFLWGAKQEYTETWYGLFSKENLPTEPIDALEEVFKGQPLADPAPSIVQFTLEGKPSTGNIRLKAEEKYNAEVVTKTGIDTSAEVSYTWRLMEESTDKKSGGDAEKEATERMNLKKKGTTSSRFSFRTPTEAGQYRLFITAVHNKKIAYANIPFVVSPKAAGEKQSRFVKMKYVDMNSVQQQ